MRDNININYRDIRILLDVIDYYMIACYNDTIPEDERVSLPRLRALRNRFIDVPPPKLAAKRL